jgi:hypothetical protein
MTTIEAGIAAVRPAIISVTDASNTPIPNGGSTSDTSVTLNGTAEANSVVVICDGPAFKGSASVVSAGTWAKSISNLAAETHRFTARTADGALISDEWVINVGASLDLIAPTVVGAAGGMLDPMQALAGARVVVAYAGMNTTDSIALSWNGQLDVAPPQYGSNLGSVTFDIPAWAVGAVIGKTINLLYVVARNGVSTLSDTLMLQVASLPESALEAPKIAQAPDDQNLDVGVLTADADLSVKPWPFINAGQRISLRFEGTKADGTAYNWPHPTWQNMPITSTAMPSTTIGLAHLKELKDASVLRLVFEVSFDGGLSTTAFPIRSYRIKSYLWMEEFESVPFQQVHMGQPLTLPSMRITNVSFPSGTISGVRIFPRGEYVPGRFSGHVLYCDVNQSTGHGNNKEMKIDILVPCRRLRFLYIISANSSFGPVAVTLYSASGARLNRFVLKNTSQHEEFDFSHQSGIARIDFLAWYESGISYASSVELDCFRFDD